jgi:signal transduction histidine kinase
VVLLAAAVTIWHTVRGMGPFGGVEAQQSLIQLQTFMGVLAATGLLLAAATAERRTGDRRRAAAHAVGGVLATARDLTDAAPVILKAIGSNLEWQFGGLWIVDDDGRELRCAATWTDGSRNVRTFNDVSRRMSFARGVGLPGRVWATGQAAWVRDVVRDTNFPRAPFAHAAGLHGAFAFPIHLAGSVVGVVECFNRVVLPPDAGLLATMSTVGHQIGQFIGRRRVDAAKARAERERDEMFEREQRARREAETANRAKDEFLATLSHELRTPLNAIVGWTRMLLDGSLNETDARKALHVIDRNAQLQTQLIADILDVSRIITGGLRLNPGPVNFGQLIGAAVEAIEPAARAKNIRLASCVRLSAQVHEGDPERLQQVVWNLVANAVKFTPSGGSVEVTAVDGDRGGVRIRVEDTGMGIDPSFLPYVFDRFRQADGSISRRHGGLGLGLAIVRHLVELHGGTVRAESRGLGHGATFLVDLPQPDQTLLR